MAASSTIVPPAATTTAASAGLRNTAPQPAPRTAPNVPARECEVDPPVMSRRQEPAVPTVRCSSW
jgi:hypothetical protein